MKAQPYAISQQNEISKTESPGTLDDKLSSLQHQMENCIDTKIQKLTQQMEEQVATRINNSIQTLQQAMETKLEESMALIVTSVSRQIDKSIREAATTSTQGGYSSPLLTQRMEVQNDIELSSGSNTTMSGARDP